MSFLGVVKILILSTLTGVRDLCVQERISDTLALQNKPRTGDFNHKHGSLGNH